MMDTTVERIVTLGSRSGLHARPAALFVQQARTYQSQITLRKGEQSADGKSILSILTLGAEQGDQVTLQINGNDAGTALDTLTRLLEGDQG
jgi:phosphocarrier protein HPr